MGIASLDPSYGLRYLLFAGSIRNIISPGFAMPAIHEIPVIEFDYPALNSGRNTTVRRGSKWHLVPRVRLRLSSGEVSEPVDLQTELKNFLSLSDEDIAFEHDPRCRTLDGLLAELQRIYSGFDPSEEVTVCHFTIY